MAENSKIEWTDQLTLIDGVRIERPNCYDEVIERGPHWITIVSIKITLNRQISDLKNLTVEEDALL